MWSFTAAIIYIVLAVALYIIYSNHSKDGFQNKTPDIEIVIANYEEDIEWVNQIPTDLYDKLTIYNKGKPKNYDIK